MPNSGGSREQTSKADEKSRKGSAAKQAEGKSGEKKPSSATATKNGAKSSDTRKSH